MRVLIAGVGNIFLTDDGFGPEVMRHLAALQLPAGFTAVDFGIRGLHLAYELLEGYEAVVIVDAAPRDLPAGTVSLLQVDPDSFGPGPDGPLLDAHGMEPVAILRTLGSLGGRVDRVYVLACEPADIDEGLGLTPAVAAAVPAAVEALLRLVDQLVEQAVPALNPTTGREVTT
ncbi:MAG TPA: hydrogenase maturation protease [Sporichthyaceae bacterium]|nr:hydrogenase maturation protease [Sporichthyaceae bacterium]